MVSLVRKENILTFNLSTVSTFTTFTTTRVVDSEFVLYKFPYFYFGTESEYF